MRSTCWMGIDPSYSAYAFVCVYPDGTHAEKVLDLSPKQVGEGSRRLDMIFRILSYEFEMLYTHLDIKAVAIEGYAIQAKFGREIAGELGALSRVVTVRELHKVPIIVPPYSLKKFVTGDRRADKAAMVDGVEAKWGVRMKTHDRADAYGLAMVARASQKGTDVDYERAVLAGLSTLEKPTPRT